MGDLRLVSGVRRVATVECNHCGVRVQGDLSETVEDLRGRLREQGWLCRDDVDVCPSDRIAP